MRYLLTISYDGSDFFGFQRQKDLLTIQGELEKVLSTILQEDIQIVSSGRTDAKVHALGQVAHFDTKKEIKDLDKFVYSVNSMINKAISILSIQEVPSDFHARYSSKEKTYLYKIFLSKGNEPLKRKYYHICSYNLDIDKMQQACKKFLGEHDFTSFCVNNEQLKSNVREIYDIHLEVKNEGKEIDLYVTGNGFLHNMVRSIAGTLIDVGRGRFDIDDIDRIFAEKNHQKAGKTLDGYGLYLVKVIYK